MSDQLAASLERLHSARFQAYMPPPSDAPNGPSGLEKLPQTVPARALAARRHQQMAPHIGHLTQSETEDDARVMESPWVAAAQGRMSTLDDQKGKPRLALGARAALAGAFALVALAGGIFAAHLLNTQAQPVTIIPAPTISSNPGAAELFSLPEPAGGVPPGNLAEQAGATVIVHVAGAVAQPGIASLPTGSRVAQAIEQAGGALADADLTAINLARVVIDGEQILVPLVGQTLPDAPGTLAPTTPQLDLTQVRDENGKINLNKANSALLQELPGIGPALAGRIIEYRQSLGGFSSVEQLQQVSGIGPSVMNDVRDKVAV